MSLTPGRRDAMCVQKRFCPLPVAEQLFLRCSSQPAVVDDTKNNACERARVRGTDFGEALTTSFHPRLLPAVVGWLAGLPVGWHLMPNGEPRK